MQGSKVKRYSGVILALVLAGLALAAQSAAQVPQVKLTSAPYAWENVQIVGGGFVDGIVFHPTEKGLRYARTDIGGAYRWNDAARHWEPLLDWVPYPDRNLMGVESIAVDPCVPTTVVRPSSVRRSLSSSAATRMAVATGNAWRLIPMMGRFSSWAHATTDCGRASIRERIGLE
jgi:hypothetical protein